MCSHAVDKFNQGALEMAGKQDDNKYGARKHVRNIVISFVVLLNSLARPLESLETRNCFVDNVYVGGRRVTHIFLFNG